TGVQTCALPIFWSIGPGRQSAACGRWPAGSGRSPAKACRPEGDRGHVRTRGRAAIMKITIMQGDITAVAADVIVNAANSTLLGGGGVDGAIHAVAGRGLLEECEKLRREELPDGLPAGRAAVTKAHNLPADGVSQAVGPNRHAGETDVAGLESAFTSALHAADRVGAHTIAVPAIGAGAYGWAPADVAAAAHRAL